MGISFGSVPVQRIWRDGDAFTASHSGETVWTSSVIAEWERLADSGQVTLLLHQGTSSFLTIPARLDELPVTSLAASACNYTAAKMVIIPASVTLLS